MIHVFGHLNPDSDSICSALVVADWLCSRGKDAQAFRLGELTPETTFILNHANVNAPPLLTKDLTDEAVWLVDFSDVEQGPPSLMASNIIGLIDHHRLGSLTTDSPLDIWVRRVGSSATVIMEILNLEPEYKLSRSQARLLLGAILSDTLCLKSPTTTESDKQVVAQLLSIAAVDYESYKTGLLQAKTDIKGLSAKQLLERDAKQYAINGHKISLSQLEVQDAHMIAPLLNTLLLEMNLKKDAENLALVVLIITDIIAEDSTLYFSDNSLIDPAAIHLVNVVSRKKQVLPWLTKWLNAQ